MKNVLAELHSLINELEDQGLTSEASSLQEVFVRVAQEAEEMPQDAEMPESDDLSNDVAGLLKSHSAAEVLAEIAKQMGGAEETPTAEPESDTETMSFAFGDEPDSGADPEKQKIVSKYTMQYITQKMSANDALAAAQAEWSKQDTDPIVYQEITSGNAKAPGHDYAAGMAKSIHEEQRRHKEQYPNSYRSMYD